MNFLVKALSEGIQDAGVRHFSNYPGFHSNELHAALGGTVTSPDEKSAFAYGWGCSLAGRRAAVSFKNVGLNDAADAFLGAHFVGCRAGLVLFLFDDCDIQHSQSRIDIRPYFLVYGGLWLEPRSVPEAYDFARRAFGLSERFGLPVVVRVTNILWDQGLAPAVWERATETPPSFEPLRRLPDASPWVVHPSEAHRMEADLARKNAAIADFVETLHGDCGAAPDAIVVGARRSCLATAPFRACTLPLPAKAIRRAFAGKPAPVVYEHGATPFATSLVDAVLRPTPACEHRDMPPMAGMRPKYHNHDFMETLFGALRAVPGSVVSGDLGGYTMDPGRTLHLCLCFGVATAVAMGFAEASPETRVFAVIGDAAYLHSGQQSLYEMEARGVDATVLVLENGGALGTGGQGIPGDLTTHPASFTFHELDYPALSRADIERFLAGLPAKGRHLVVVHTHEQESSHGTH